MLPFLLNPRSPNSMLSSYHGILYQKLFRVVSNIELGGGGGGGQSFVLSMFNNFVILAGMVSRVLSKIVGFPVSAVYLFTCISRFDATIP
jgi:hypothetical protein